MTDWRDQEPERADAPDWVRGWALARFRNRDFRLWPEQQTGYGEDWPIALETHGLMPASDREDYVAEGLTVPFHGLAALMTGVVVAEPELATDSEEQNANYDEATRSDGSADSGGSPATGDLDPVGGGTRLPNGQFREGSAQTPRPVKPIPALADDDPIPF